MNSLDYIPANLTITDDPAAQARLDREIAILRDGAVKFDCPAQGIVNQLVAEAGRPLPVEPPRPKWVRFEWPESGRC